METPEKKIKRPPFLISTRFLLAILVFFGYALQYAQKIDMSVAIVCMINNTAIRLEKAALESGNSSEAQQNITLLLRDDQCPKKSASQQATDGEFVWPKAVQGYILASYFYGYTLSNLPGGWLSLKLGGKYVNFFAVLLGSAATLLTPISARLHFGALIAARAVTGFCHGVMWPAVAGLWAHWAVPEERSRLVSFGSAGSQIGNVIALPLGSFLCAAGFGGGWPSIFYVFGIAGVVWCAAWFFLVANSPNEHKFITKKEKDYILHGTNISKEKRATPWKSMLTSKALIALFIGHVCSNWGTYLFLTNIPTYMNEVLKFDIKSNGGLSALPYIMFWLVIIISGIIADRLLQVKKSPNLSKLDEKKHMEQRRKLVRRIFNGFGYLVPMVAVIGLSFVTCQHPYVGVGLLVLGIAAIGCQYGAGFLVNYNDLCGKYAGVALGLGNTFASIPGILAPYLVGFVTKNQKQEEWRIVFLVTAGVYLIGALVLFIFAEARPEPWVAAATAQPSAQEIEQPEETIPLREGEKTVNS